MSARKQSQAACKVYKGRWLAGWLAGRLAGGSLAATKSSQTLDRPIAGLLQHFHSSCESHWKPSRTFSRVYFEPATREQVHRAHGRRRRRHLSLATCRPRPLGDGLHFAAAVRCSFILRARRGRGHFSSTRSLACAHLAHNLSDLARPELGATALAGRLCARPLADAGSAHLPQGAGGRRRHQRPLAVSRHCGGRRLSWPEVGAQSRGRERENLSGARKPLARKPPQSTFDRPRRRERKRAGSVGGSEWTPLPARPLHLKPVSW